MLFLQVRAVSLFTEPAGAPGAAPVRRNPRPKNGHAHLFENLHVCRCYAKPRYSYQAAKAGNP